MTYWYKIEEQNKYSLRIIEIKQMAKMLPENKFV